MNIFRQFLYRYCLWDEHLEELEKKIASRIGGHDEYDEYLLQEIEKIPQIQFIDWILTEIDLLFKDLSGNKLSFSNGVIDKLSLVKNSIFDVYLFNHVKKIDSLESKIKFLELYNILITLYDTNSTSDKMNISQLTGLKVKFLDKEEI